MAENVCFAAMNAVANRNAEKKKAGNHTMVIPGFLSGGAKRDRTADLHTASVALSQLSYGPRLVQTTSDQATRCGREYSHEVMSVSTPFEGKYQ